MPHYCNSNELQSAVLKNRPSFQARGHLLIEFGSLFWNISWAPSLSSDVAAYTISQHSAVFCENSHEIFWNDLHNTYYMAAGWRSNHKIIRPSVFKRCFAVNICWHVWLQSPGLLLLWPVEETTREGKKILHGLVTNTKLKSISQPKLVKKPYSNFLC